MLNNVEELKGYGGYYFYHITFHYKVLSADNHFYNEFQKSYPVCETQYFFWVYDELNRIRREL